MRRWYGVAGCYLWPLGIASYGWEREGTVFIAQMVSVTNADRNEWSATAIEGIAGIRPKVPSKASIFSHLGSIQLFLIVLYACVTGYSSVDMVPWVGINVSLLP